MTRKKEINTQIKKNTFSFGKNWQNYLNTLTKKRILIAKKSLKDYLGLVRDKTFLDIGCGSGLFSYCIYKMGAKKITSFDVDPYSVECVEYLKKIVNNPKNWNIYHGSILDKNFISQFEKFDIVYSWGVLHHTGNIWEGIKNSVSLVKDNGLLYIAIYNKTNTSKIWLKIKELYNISTKIGKLIMDFTLFSFYHFIFPLCKLKNPFKLFKEFEKNRGMNPIINIKDWLGGYPYEYATFTEILKYIKNLDSNFKLIKYFKNNSTGNNEFLFEKIKKLINMPKET